MARKVDVEGAYILIDADTVKALLDEYDKTVTTQQASEIVDYVADDNNFWDDLATKVADAYQDKFGWE